MAVLGVYSVHVVRNNTYGILGGNPMSRTGRPKSENPKAIRYSIRLDIETEKALQQYCKQNQITRGEAVRKAILLMLGK